ncbi:MAG: hypothetical protein QW334_00280 [Thermofilum sp.]
MIKITQVKTKQGETILNIQADFPDGTVKNVEIGYSEVEDRLKKIQELLGREPSEQDFKDIVKAIVSEIRVMRKPLVKKFPFENMMNIDLEAEEVKEA